MADPSVLIVGAGPTGLVLALWLTKLGVPVRIIDKAERPGTTSRALAVHARTLELYEQLDLADAVVAKGHKVPTVRLWVAGEQKASVSFAQIGSDLTRYPFLHIFPQDEHERLLIERLSTLGVEVERSTELLGYADDGARITAELRGPDGRTQVATAAFIAGCDGARSKVREVMDTGFPGGTYNHVFYVADVEARGPAVNGDLNIDLDEADFMAVFPLAEAGRVRLIGTVDCDDDGALDQLGFDDVRDRTIRSLKLEVERVNWFSVYRVHHRVTEHFRRGRALLLGDAAHVHSPAGGQGMNTGIGDAVNLAWKLAAVLGGAAPEALLDSYEAERRAFAVRLVRTTDQGFSFATAEGPLAEIVRTRLIPLVLPRLVKIEHLREWMFRTVSQITLNYRDQALSEGQAGQVRGGDRMPWVEASGVGNHAALRHMDWQVQLFGEAPAALQAWCAENDVPLHVFPWTAAQKETGVERNALYLLRPDTYVALADPHADVATLQRYFDRRRIRPGGRSG